MCCCCLIWDWLLTIDYITYFLQSNTYLHQPKLPACCDFCGPSAGSIRQKKGPRPVSIRKKRWCHSLEYFTILVLSIAVLLPVEFIQCMCIIRLCCCSNIQEMMQKKAETALDCLKFCSKNPLNLKAFGHKKKAVCENASHYRYMLNYPIRSILW